MPKVIDHEEARETIADAFVRVISAKGSASVTMREVAREAGCSQTLPLYYFDTRQALVEFAFARQADRAVDELHAVTKSDRPVSERLTRTITGLIERSSSSATVWRTVIGLIVENSSNSRVGELDRKCYNQFLDTLTDLLDEFARVSTRKLDARAEAIMLLTSTDGLAFATASLGSEAETLTEPLTRLWLERYDLQSG